MKILNRILFISLLTTSFIFTEEEEVRTIDKDGTIYKINNTSLHITPADDNAISKASDHMKGAEKIVSSSNKSNEKKSCDIDLDISFGTHTAFGDVYTDLTNPGTSMAIQLNCPKKINFLGQEFSQSYRLSFANLEGNNVDDMGFTNVYYVLNSSFDKINFLSSIPLEYSFFGGLSDVEAINDVNSGIHLSLGTSISYKLPVKNCNLYLYLSMTQTTDGENTYGLYSTGLNYNKALNCSK